MGVSAVTSCETVLGVFVTSCNVMLTDAGHSPFSVDDVGHSSGEFPSWLAVSVTRLEVLLVMFDSRTIESVLTGFPLWMFISLAVTSCTDLLVVTSCEEGLILLEVSMTTDPVLWSVTTCGNMMSLLSETCLLVSLHMVIWLYDITSSEDGSIVL